MLLGPTKAPYARGGGHLCPPPPLDESVPPSQRGVAIQILVGPPVLRLPQVGSSMVIPPPPLGPPSFYFIVFKIKSKTVGMGLGGGY